MVILERVAHLNKRGGTELRLEVRELDMCALNDSLSRGNRSVQGALP